MLWRFPINVMAFPINGMAPGLAAGPGRGQVALGTSKVALALGAPGVGAPRRFLCPKRHLAMAWRHSINWERHNIKWERHNIKWKRRGGVGVGGVGWGGGEAVSN